MTSPREDSPPTASAPSGPPDPAPPNANRAPPGTHASTDSPSKFAVVEPEEADALAAFRAAAIAFYRPTSSQEFSAVECIADAQHALQRCAAVETGLFTAALNEATADEVDTQDRAFCLAAGFERLCQKSDSFKLFLRYQAQSECQYRRAVEEFEHLKAQRDASPNKPTDGSGNLSVATSRKPAFASAPNEPTTAESGTPSGRSALSSATFCLISSRDAHLLQ